MKSYGATVSKSEWRLVWEVALDSNMDIWRTTSFRDVAEKIYSGVLEHTPA